MKQIQITHTTAGMLLFLGSLQWIVLSIITNPISEDTLPVISNIYVQIHFLSPDVLSIPLSIFLYSSSMIFFGAVTVVSAVIIYDTYRFALFSILFSLSGICMAGMGIFSEFDGTIQILKALWVLTLSLTAVCAYFLVKKPVSYCSLLTGFFCLAIYVLPDLLGPFSPLAVFGTADGKKALDYTLVLWVTVLGGYFMGCPGIYSMKRKKNPGKGND